MEIFDVHKVLAKPIRLRQSCLWILIAFPQIMKYLVVNIKYDVHHMFLVLLVFLSVQWYEPKGIALNQTSFLKDKSFLEDPFVHNYIIIYHLIFWWTWRVFCLFWIWAQVSVCVLPLILAIFHFTWFKIDSCSTGWYEVKIALKWGEYIWVKTHN